MGVVTTGQPTVEISATEHYLVTGAYNLKRWHPGDGLATLTLAQSTAAIQAAVAAAAGGTLIIPEGDYPYDATDPCTVASNTTIRGEGYHSAFHLTNVTPGGPYPIGDGEELFDVPDGTANVRFENFRIYGDGDDDPDFVSNQSAGIRLWAVEDVNIYGVTFDNLLGFTAQNADTAYRVNVVNCLMRSCGNGLNVSAENSIQAFNTLYRTESIECAGRYSQIVYNNFKECYYGISVGGFTTPGAVIHGIVVAGNLIQDTTNGAIAVADGLYGAVIANNRIHKCGGAGISVASAGYNPVDRAVIVGNIISSAGKAATSPGSARGIYNDGTNTTIVSNTVYDAGVADYQSNFCILSVGTGARIAGNNLGGALTKDLALSTGSTTILGQNIYGAGSLTFSGATSVTLTDPLEVTNATIPTASLFSLGSKIIIPDAAAGIGKFRTSNGTNWIHDDPKQVASGSIGTSQVAVAHGLGYTPSELTITMTSAGTMWRSAASDATNVYVTADAAARTAVLGVR